MPRKRKSFERLEVEIKNDGSLPPRRAEVFRLLVQGYSTQEIAGELGIRPDTVSWHLDELQDQFHARSRVDLVSQGWMHGILNARQAVRALVILLAILSSGPAIRAGRTFRTPAQRTVQSLRIGRRETTREIGGLS